MRQSKEQVLVIRGGALGDFVLTLPLLRRIRNAFPRALVNLVGYPGIAALAVEERLVDTVERLDSPRFMPLFAGRIDSAGELAAWLRGFRAAIVIWRDPERIMARALCAAGISDVTHVEPIPPQSAAVHAVDFALAQLPDSWKAGLDDPAIPTLHVGEESRAWGHAYLRRLLGGDWERLIVLHPGSGGHGPNRHWPATHFAGLARKTSLRPGGRCVLIEGPADVEAVRAVQSELDCRHIPVVKDVSPLQLAAILSQSDSFIGNDSGVSHLAAALGLPTVAIFGVTDCVIWAPRGTAVAVLQAPGGPRVASRISDVSIAQAMSALTAVLGLRSRLEEATRPAARFLTNRKLQKPQVHKGL
jgi:heptosyltransferase III